MFTTLYFAYGSKMDLTQINNRCERAGALGTAEPPFHRFIINSRGAATAVPDRASTVRGLLWRMAKKDERSLDRHEGAV